MPRKPDPNLEKSILEAALRLLENDGIEAVTMREVAKAARTTTPTIYERFRDHDALISAVTDFHRDRMIATMSPEDSLEQSGSKFFDYCRRHPNTVDLLLSRIAGNLKAKKPGPVYEMVRGNLMNKDGLTPREAEEMTMASSSMIFGTALLVSRLGGQTQTAKDLERATLKMMRRLVASYQK